MWIQDLLDSKMDKRRKGVFGPAAGKKFYIYIDGITVCQMKTKKNYFLLRTNIAH